MNIEKGYLFNPQLAITTLPVPVQDQDQVPESSLAWILSLYIIMDIRDLVAVIFSPVRKFSQAFQVLWK